MAEDAPSPPAKHPCKLSIVAAGDERERGTSVELAESTTKDPLASSRPADFSRRIGHAAVTSAGGTIETPCNAGDRKERVFP